MSFFPFSPYSLASKQWLDWREGGGGRKREGTPQRNKISPVNSIKNVHKAVLCLVISLSSVTVRDLHLNSGRGISNNSENQTVTVTNTWPLSGWWKPCIFPKILRYNKFERSKRINETERHNALKQEREWEFKSINEKGSEGRRNHENKGKQGSKSKKVSVTGEVNKILSDSTHKKAHERGRSHLRKCEKQWAGMWKCSIAHDKYDRNRAEELRKRLRARKSARKSRENKWGETKHENSLSEKKTQKHPPVVY